MPILFAAFYGVNKRNFALVKLGWKISLCIGFSCNAIKQWQKEIFHSGTKSSNCTVENMRLLDRVRFFCFLATFIGIKKGWKSWTDNSIVIFLRWCPLKVVYCFVSSWQRGGRLLCGLVIQIVNLLKAGWNFNFGFPLFFTK